MKRFLTIAGVTLASFVVLMLLLAGLTQTAFFKDRLRSILVNAAADQINGTLVLGTIDGDFLSGVTVDSVAVYDRGELVARTGKLAGETNLFLYPGARFERVGALLTNFHLPRSTLFMLVSAFSGLETMQRAYAHAIASGYRFYSYGDACLLHRAA